MPESFEDTLKRAFIAIQGIKIPEVPEEIIALDKEISSRYPNTQNMINIIGKNAVLAGELLKIANSPAIKPKNTITSITQAVSILGTTNLKNMLIAAALKQLWDNNNTVRDILDHSADVAFCAAEISHLVQGISPDEAYLAGLFHNGGAILLSSKDSKAYNELFFQSQSSPFSSIAKEEEKFGSNHAAVGLLLAKKWFLPDFMVYGIFYHHIEKCSRIADERTRLLVAILKVANSIVSEISLGSYVGSEMRDYYQDGLETLMLSEADMKEVKMALQTYSLGYK